MSGCEKQVALGQVHGSWMKPSFLVEKEDLISKYRSGMGPSREVVRQVKSIFLESRSAVERQKNEDCVRW